MCHINLCISEIKAWLAKQEFHYSYIENFLTHRVFFNALNLCCWFPMKFIFGFYNQLCWTIELDIDMLLYHNVSWHLVNGTKNVVVSPKKYAENPHQCNINVGPSRHPLGKMEFWRKGAFSPDHKVKSWKVSNCCTIFVLNHWLLTTANTLESGHPLVAIGRAVH